MKVDMQELVDASMPSIIESFRNELKNKISWQVQEDAAKIVSAHVQEWVKENILPEITKILVESRNGLIVVAEELAPRICEKLNDSLVESMTEKLKNSWSRNQIFEALFK